MKERISGIYMIRNKVNDKIYIGLSGNIRPRWISHHSQLRRGLHKNQHLQAAWDKYGEGNFAFEIVERCGQGELPLKEQFWITLFKTTDPRNGYNKQLATMKYSSGGTGLKKTERKVVDFIRKNLLSIGLHPNELASMIGVGHDRMIDMLKNRTWYDEDYADSDLLERSSSYLRRIQNRRFGPSSSGWKLNWEKVDFIHEKCAEGWSIPRIGRALGVNVTTIRCVVKGKTWREEDRLRTSSVCPEVLLEFCQVN